MSIVLVLSLVAGAVGLLFGNLQKNRAGLEDNLLFAFFLTIVGMTAGFGITWIFGWSERLIVSPAIFFICCIAVTFFLQSVETQNKIVAKNKKIGEK